MSLCLAAESKYPNYRFLACLRRGIIAVKLKAFDDKHYVDPQEGRVFLARYSTRLKAFLETVRFLSDRNLVQVDFSVVSAL
jgi:hypothetical protein